MPRMRRTEMHSLGWQLTASRPCALCHRLLLLLLLLLPTLRSTAFRHQIGEPFSRCRARIRMTTLSGYARVHRCMNYMNSGVEITYSNATKNVKIIWNCENTVNCCRIVWNKSVCSAMYWIEMLIVNESIAANLYVISSVQMCVMRIF